MLKKILLKKISVFAAIYLPSFISIALKGQTLAQMAISWLLAQDVTSVIIGASSVKQLDDNLQAINNIHFTEEEMKLIKA